MPTVTVLAWCLIASTGRVSSSIACVSAAVRSSTTVDGVPVPVVTSIDANGNLVTTVLVPNAGETLAEAVARTGTRRFRYLVGAAGYLFALGSAELTFGAGGFKYADETLDDGSTVVGAANELFTLSFTIDGTTATPLDPGHGGGIDLHLLNGRGKGVIVHPVAAAQ